MTALWSLAAIAGLAFGDDAKENVAKALATKITCKIQKQPLADAFGELGKAAGIEVTIDKEALNTSAVDRKARVTLSSKDEELSEVLNALLQPRGLTYRLDGARLSVCGVPMKVAAALDTPVTYSFADKSLTAIAQSLAYESKVEIVIDATALAKAQIDAGQAVTHHAKSQKLSSALAGLLQPLGLTYRIEDETIRVIAIPDRVKKALDSATTLDFNDTPLLTALEFLATYHDIEIHPDAKEFAKVQADAEAPVTAKLEVKFKDALTALLKPFKLTYRVEGWRLRIIASP